MYAQLQKKKKTYWDLGGCVAALKSNQKKKNANKIKIICSYVTVDKLVSISNMSAVGIRYTNKNN